MTTTKEREQNRLGAEEKKSNIRKCNDKESCQSRIPYNETIKRTLILNTLTDRKLHA